MPSYFPASVEIAFHEALSLNFVRDFCAITNSRDPEIDTKCLFQKGK